jgi:hypothetical protein
MKDSTTTSPFARLDTSLMRSTKPLSPSMEKPVSQETSIPGTQEIAKRAFYPKKTYNLHPDVVDMLEEIKRKLGRQYHIKASREEIVEEAIRQIHEDFQKSQETSKLVIQFTRNPGTPKP